METVGLGGRKAAGHGSDPVGSLVAFAVGEKPTTRQEHSFVENIAFL